MPKTVKKPVRAPAILVYSLPGCPWCAKCKSKLRQNKLKFTEVPYTQSGGVMHNGKRAESFPQVWVNGRQRGGFSDMDKWVPGVAKIVAKSKQ